MKIVKMNLFLICLLSTFWSCISCSKDNGNVMPDFSFVNVDRSKIYFDNEGEEQTFTILSPSMDFSVSLPNEAASWLRYKVDKKNVTVSVDKNVSKEIRTEEIIIKSGDKSATVKIQQGFTRALVGYIYFGYDGIPDVSKFTHLNYAFGDITDTYDGLYIQNEEKFSQIVKLKEQHPDLKILISVGGATQDAGLRFYHMTANPNYRSSFIKNCMELMEKYNFDGYDMDWETPTSQKEMDNFNALMREFRQAMGPDRLLTLASPCQFIAFDFNTLDKYVDFVNVMGYDIDTPPFHQSGLYRSELTSKCSIEEGLQLHIKSGMPAHKLVMGTPFYGLAKDDPTLPDFRFVDYKDIPNIQGFTERWDEVACAPYLTNSMGQFVCTFDNPRSIKIKCQYVKDNNYLGMMFWHYDADDGILRNTMADGLK